MFEKLFKLKEHKTDMRTEILAGVTTFMTMAYILAVNPGILGIVMDAGGVFTATALSAAVATLVMALVANLPFALAPGMGLNAFFVFYVCMVMEKSWQFALTAVLLEGIIFIVLSLTDIRSAILNCIPKSIKHAISIGIGLFIAFIGLQGAGIVVNNDATLVGLGDVFTATAGVALLGILLTGILVVRKVKGGLLIGILATTLIGIPFGVTDLSMFDASQLFKIPSLSEVAFKFVGFDEIFTMDMVIVLLTFLFVDMFDTVGTLIGVSDKAGFLDENGELPNAKKALLADAVGTTVGACLGTSTVTTYVESASGVAEGGKTGMTAFTTAILFILALFFAPVFLLVPAAATAPALFIVGLFMMSPITKIDWDDYSEALAAFVTLIMMPLTYSISHGIALGVITYTIVKLATGKSKDIAPLTYGVTAIFIIGFLIDAL
jgi:AGZA family xanthine/uracil permease-like MFS transporter